ncbi:HAD-like domain-containing protein [Pseudoneurospora amorphoporcata]|uniref:HAD-like domain-containing protein n=1 Tax=Pseudoneurospora amorphoporcata TaxID=241081 RepID=A0AAN6P124_9PEZI|nr:HAD-like domain-containing protein [Pseudoneurospora amorphoporcata]
MNSLNIISSRVSPTSSPAPSRSNSISALSLAHHLNKEEDGNHGSRSNEELLGLANKNNTLSAEPEDKETTAQGGYDGQDYGPDEKTPLLAQDQPKSPTTWTSLPKRFAFAIVESMRWLLMTIAAPGLYLIALFYDVEGNFAPAKQLRKLFGRYGGNAKEMAMDYRKAAALSNANLDGTGSGGSISKSPKSRLRSSGSSSSGLSSESETEVESRRGSNSSGRRLKSKSSQDSEEIAPARRSIRIKLHSDADSLRQRKQRKDRSSASGRSTTNSDGNGGSGQQNLSVPGNDISAALKSPTSPVGALTKYPKTPAPPRPLIPKRQPSYKISAVDPANLKHQKTLILDLDETLIHSMSKGGRMSSGHMVEVRLNTTYVGVGGQQTIGPQHPILYYVHKRPHCDEFLRRVSKWYNLVVFTASVQEYADPVIDWLESDRKYFSARYYRQHCTFRHGAFIKDLSSVEPDLSKVMILDNSPLSYMFHQDNAIPIQGWISDPTDLDLMYLIPFLEGLQYVSDVRALLALRDGEDGQHTA